MKFLTLLFFLFGIFCLAFSFGREEPVLLTKSSPKECVYWVHHTHWGIFLPDRSMGEFNVTVDDKIWFRHGGGRPKGQLKRGGRVFMSDSLSAKPMQCFELKVLTEGESTPEVYFGLFAQLGPDFVNMINRSASAICFILAALLFALQRNLIRKGKIGESSNSD